MSYTDVEWSNGDVPTSTKGQQMQTNLEYVRESLRGRTVAQEAKDVESASMSTSDWKVRIAIGSLEFSSSTISSTSFGELAGLKNLDISSLTVGVAYTLTVTAEKATGDPASQGLLQSSFVAHADGGYLSVFGEVRKGAAGSNLASLRGYTAIVTRDDEGF